MTSPIAFPGADDPGGRDPVSDSVAGSVASATARLAELAADTGTRIGDSLELPETNEHSKHAGGDGAGYPT